MGTLEHQGYP
ncbi:hypothetical protein D018_3872A, partial [Vibrio parahaemolyticus VP2007-007]